MPYDIIPFFIIIISFLVIFIVIGRKISALKILDIDTMSEEKEGKIKKIILETRLKRNLEQATRIFATIAKPVFGSIVMVTRNFYYRILALEQKYKKEAREKKDMDIGPQEKIHKYLSDAQEKMKSDDTMTEAEDLFIKAIGVDNKNSDAYRGLNGLYLKIHDYKKAREVCRYLLKLSIDEYKKDGSLEKKSSVASCYANLGEIEQNLGNFAVAIKHYREALKSQPNNPKFLDLLLKISIIVKDKKLARNTLKQLKIADSDNQKIVELEKEVESI